jgi:cytochrome c
MRVLQEDFEMIGLLLSLRFRESGGNDIGMPSSRLSANLPEGLFLRSERVFSPMADKACLIRLIIVGLISCMAAFAHGPAEAQLRGHGGPVRALSVSADGATALSGSFDTSAIRWSLRHNTAEQVLRFHQGAVNAVAMLADGRAVTAGEDAQIGLWTPAKPEPDRVLEGHQGPIVGLAVSPDGATLASASWDRTIRLWPLVGGAPQVLEGHQQNVNGVAFTPDGTAMVSAGYDATVRVWPLKEPASPLVVSLPSPLNAVVVAPDGDIIAAGADGKVYFLSPAGDRHDPIQVSSRPITSLAISRNGELIAAAGMDGSIAIVDRKMRSVTHRLVGPGPPVWSVAFLPDNQTLLSGGTDRMIRRWDALNGEPMGTAVTGASEESLAAYAGDPGAQVFRACVACHTLNPDEGNRAGPTLHGIFGRRIARLPGYNFSAALKQLKIVWTPETVAKLFEVGPASYTPGTKMPEQRIAAPEDRAALVEFLERATK